MIMQPAQKVGYLINYMLGEGCSSKFGDDPGDYKYLIDVASDLDITLSEEESRSIVDLFLKGDLRSVFMAFAEKAS